jgi:hypothetical protein
LDLRTRWLMDKGRDGWEAFHVDGSVFYFKKPAADEEETPLNY